MNILADTPHSIGKISFPIINPDSGKIEGFFVHSTSYSHGGNLILQTQDIEKFGKVVRVRSEDVFAEGDDLVRISDILSLEKPVLGQKIVTEGGQKIGVCKDIQFESRTFQSEWLFPKRFFRWRVAIPIADVVEITDAAIVVRERCIPVRDDRAEELSPLEAALQTPSSG